jgi:hypothetical protein
MHLLCRLMANYKISTTIILRRRKRRRRNLNPNFIRIHLEGKSFYVVMFSFYEGKT